MKVVPYPIYTLFKDLEAGMVGMQLQDEMVEMGLQDYQGRGVSLVCHAGPPGPPGAFCYVM